MAPFFSCDCLLKVFLYGPYTFRWFYRICVLLGFLTLASASTPNEPQNAPATAAPGVPPEATKPPAPPHWGYVGKGNHTEDLLPDTWSKAYPICDGHRQSPIAIETRFIVNDPALKPFTFVRYDASSRNDNWTVVNNGHVAQFSGHYATPPEIRGGSLGEDYVFLQFHFHWGAVNTRGSEHVIDEQRFPLELHIVHRKSAFYDSEAAGDSTGLAVLGIMFEVSENPVDTNDPHFVHINSMISALSEVTNPGQSHDVILKGFRLLDLLPSSPVYYRYLGSLTTPPCAEAVIWTVFKEPMQITQAQLNMFRSLREHPGMNDTTNVLVDNFRPVQQRNGREVKVYSGQVLTTTTKGPFLTTEVAVTEPTHGHPADITAAPTTTTAKPEDARGSGSRTAEILILPLSVYLLFLVAVA
ncbi:carbonic anhydrase 2-like isoform X2 [Paramacrobiotus metropolitanus]|uniref:carbonic anhydrase 2-like isoform X2 n=1 Tax=Paramacrobiotus metropolitanus TaxID=2943436 RepID=UPI002445B490|nr:carbonic anhydrase 2-like isoform X2 [Paramacrobiotus metropolitanus]